MPSTTLSHGSEADDVDPRDDLCRHLGYGFTDASLLELALRHRSWCSEHGSVESNERLEFLGDAILGLVVTDHLFRAAPDMSEGVLARHRSELVSAAALAGVARSVNLGDALSLGKGEESTGGRDKTSILADGMEAVIGAVYLDGGIGAATTLVLHLLDERIEDVLSGGGGADMVFGGVGADVFALLALTDSTVDPAGRDTVGDYAALAGDLIGLSGLDADAGLGGDQAFTFIGASAFSAAGQVRAEVVGGMTVVSGNVNADLGADFALQLTGGHTLNAGNFVL